MTFKEWFLTIDVETRKEFVVMGPFALKRIAELAWNKSREEALIEIANLKYWELTPKVKDFSLPDNEEIDSLEKGD